MKEKKLLFSITKKDFDIQTFASGGPGGQHQNKTESGVRIVHRDSGAVGESREHRSQHQNKQAAFLRLTKSPKFLAWHKKRVAELLSNELLMEAGISQAVDAMMAPQNLKVEVFQNGNWELA
jgi:protein subunit release factor B